MDILLKFGRQDLDLIIFNFDSRTKKAEFNESQFDIITCITSYAGRMR